ncbi:MAG: LysM peptidoglycan-binding domain-containing protein [Planctomycetes bacterium]|nr:LysM peptidoglycan-binding domain-containing protein [Planctomycetota bacterium]
MTFRTKTFFAILILLGGAAAAYLNRKPDHQAGSLPAFAPATFSLRDQTGPAANGPITGSAWPGPIELSGPATPSLERRPISLAPVAPTAQVAPAVAAPSNATMPNSFAAPQPVLAPIQPKVSLEYNGGDNQPAAVGYLRHRVREGETLSSIAQQYLGSAGRYREIFEANRAALRSPNQVRVGMDLVIPMRGDEPTVLPPSQAQLMTTEPRYSGATSATNAAPGETVWTQSLPEHRGLRTYQVRASDTLAGIARQFYGDPREAQRLFEANRDLLRVPDDLREGMTLVIPQ